MHLFTNLQTNGQMVEWSKLESIQQAKRYLIAQQKRLH